MSETAAALLHDALAELGVTRVYRTDGDGMSVLSVWANLTVWCAGGRFRWRDGYEFEDWVTHPAGDPVGAAVKIKARLEELRGRRRSLGAGARGGPGPKSSGLRRQATRPATPRRV